MNTERPRRFAASNSISPRNAFDAMTNDSSSSPVYDESILRSLRRIIRAVDIHSKQLAQQHQLTAPQLVCLRELQRQPAISAGRLAHAVALSPATITGIVDRLESRGLVRRRRCTEDRRQVLVQITDEGIARVDAAPLPLNERFSRRLAELPEEDQAEIDRVLHRVVELMEAEEIDAAPLLGAGSTNADPGELVDDGRSGVAPASHQPIAELVAASQNDQARRSRDGSPRARTVEEN